MIELCFLDFVVGAPYDGEDRQGAVYVFHGTTEGKISRENA
jgi:hypothetical protein